MLCFSLAKAVTYYVNALVWLKSFCLWSWDNMLLIFTQHEYKLD